MDYHVVVITDEALTAQDWVLIETSEAMVFAVKESALCAETVAEGWAAYRMLDRRHTPCRQPGRTEPTWVPLRLLAQGA